MKLFHPIPSTSSALILAAAILFKAATAAASLGTSCHNATAHFHPSDWKYCQVINDELHIYYTPLDDTSNLMLGLHAINTFGWTALGPAGNGGMKGASQIVVRRNNENEEWIVEDRYSFHYDTPSLDENQNVQLLFAKQTEDGETAWGVILPQNSCDAPYDYAIENRSMYLLWALGSDHEFMYHERRGAVTANFMEGPSVEETLEENYEYFDLVMPNVSVVRGEQELNEGQDPTNIFQCTYFDMNTIAQEMNYDPGTKLHMVGYSPVFSDDNEEFLHHFILRSCGVASSPLPMIPSQQFDDSDLYHGKVISDCTNMPPGCQGGLGGWAVGSKGVTYPDDVGVSIGEERWVVLQTHYYNPNMVEGVYDSSGLRAYVTKDLRPIEAGTMAFVVGVTAFQHPPLPGGQEDIAMETLYTEPDCTMAWKEPLNIIQVQHHSHFMGLKQEITVERDGINLGALRDEYRFDYNHQSGVDPNVAVRTLAPGDRLRATCHFDTSTVPEGSKVWIGEESNKEMCLPSLLYYPKQENGDLFLYAPPTLIAGMYISNTAWCSEPSSDEAFESECAEQLFSDTSKFSRSFMTTLPSGTNLTMLCNSGKLSDTLSTMAPNICPDNGCTDTQSCTDEELREWAEVVCKPICETLGLTLYPNVTSTRLFDTVNLGCPNRMMFDAPADVGPPSCVVKGSLPQVVEFTNEYSIQEDEDVVSIEEVDEFSAADEDSTGEDSSKAVYQDSSGCFGFTRSFYVTVVYLLIAHFLN